MYTFRPLVFAFVLGSVGAGLGTKVPDGATCPGACETRIGYAVDPRFSADERSVLAEAANAWERGSGGRVCFHEGGDDVQFFRLNEQRELEPQDPDWQKHVALCKGGRIWIVPSKVEDRAEYVALAIHELGHHLGLAHIEDTSETFMHSTINDTPRSLRVRPEIPERDRREFCKVRGCSCGW